MFFSSAPAPDPAPSALRALRLSLNTPVVAIDDLPVGPARAAIALAQEPREGLWLRVAVRLLRTGQVLSFAPDEGPEEPNGSDRDLEAAMSFAEAMGFLFDDDEVEARGEAGPREAAQLWCDLIGGAPAEPLREETGEDVAPEGEAALLWLTKFRRVEADAQLLVPEGLVPEGVVPEGAVREGTAGEGEGDPVSPRASWAAKWIPGWDGWRGAW